MKKNNYSLLGLSVFLLGGTLLFNAPTEAQASVSCATHHSCWTTIGNQPGAGGGNWQVNGRIHVMRNNFTVRAQVTRFTLGTVSSGSGSVSSGSGFTTAQSPWLTDLNNTSTVIVTGWAGN